MRIWSKSAGFSEWYKFVNAYVERDKKILKNFIFVPRVLHIWLLVIMLVVVMTNRKDYEPFLANVVFAGGRLVVAGGGFEKRRLP